jgi:hypothetical protein
MRESSAIGAAILGARSVEFPLPIDFSANTVLFFEHSF